MEEQLPDLNEAWFQEYGSGSIAPKQAAAEWSDWDKGRHNKTARYKKALAVATGLTTGAIGHYVRGETYKLSEQTCTKLDDLSQALGVAPPQRRKRKEDLVRPGRSERRVALLVQLTRVPSRPFHMEVIKSVLDGATAHNFSISLHEAQQSNLAECVERILRHYRPDGMILLRLTPGIRTAAVLKKWAVPTVLIHAHRLQYPCLPFIANVVPNQERLGAWVKAWALNELPGDSLSGKIVMVAMPDEGMSVEFPIRTDIEPAIRNERKKAIKDALKDCLTVVEVEDYSFRQAYNDDVVREYKDASAWITLSDEIGVALKHVLLAANPERIPKIMGFDDSELAQLEKITSIGQHVEDVGPMAVNALNDWFVEQTQDQANWNACKELTTDLHLALRD